MDSYEHVQQETKQEQARLNEFANLAKQKKAELDKRAAASVSNLLKSKLSARQLRKKLTRLC